MKKLLITFSILVIGILVFVVTFNAGSTEEQSNTDKRVKSELTKEKQVKNGVVKSELGTTVVDGNMSMSQALPKKELTKEVVKSSEMSGSIVMDKLTPGRSTGDTVKEVTAENTELTPIVKKDVVKLQEDKSSGTKIKDDVKPDKPKTSLVKRKKPRLIYKRPKKGEHFGQLEQYCEAATHYNRYYNYLVRRHEEPQEKDYFPIWKHDDEMKYKYPDSRWYGEKLHGTDLKEAQMRKYYDKWADDYVKEQEIRRQQELERQRAEDLREESLSTKRESCFSEHPFDNCQYAKTDAEQKQFSVDEN